VSRLISSAESARLYMRRQLNSASRYSG
jgi:hypothetical protein